MALEVSFTGGIFRRMKSVASNPSDIAAVPTHSMWHSRALCRAPTQQVALAVEKARSITKEMNSLHHRLGFFLIVKK